MNILQDSRRNAVEIDLTTIEPWNVTIAQLREAIMAWHITGPDFTESLRLKPEAKEFVPTQREVDQTSDMAREAVIAGRVIDFGMMPNDVLKYGGIRGGNLWQQGAIEGPFEEPWLLVHSWEQGVCIYLVNPRPEGIEICELQPTKFGNVGMLLISDRGIFWRNYPPEGRKTGYYATLAPASLRFLLDPADNAKANNGGDERAACAGNVGDPVMAGMLILNTRNVPRETVLAPIKLQRARAKAGKPPIPSYDRVDTSLYVTAVTASKAGGRGEDKGGTHRSPVPHVRMGHPRQYATGRSIFIHDTLVAVPPEQRAAFKARRSHYNVKS